MFKDISETEDFVILGSKCVTDLVTQGQLAVSSRGDRQSAAVSWLLLHRAPHVLPFHQKLPLRTMQKVTELLAYYKHIIHDNVQS